MRRNRQEPSMQLGVVFPQTEIGADPAGVRAYVEATEAAGYRHLLAFDHVLGANPDRPGGWTRNYTHETLWHEPMVLFGYLAAITRTLELFTGILILPQRQTALVAKQAAAVDILSGGRMRLGVGIGWNDVEYAALNEDFHNRGRRMEEQIEVLRALWSATSITFEGQWHHIPNAGINPLPAHSIPIWMGGQSERVLDRAGRLADGWMPLYRTPAEIEEPLARIHAAAVAAGRDPRAIGVDGRVSIGADIDTAVAEAIAWRDAGITQLSVNTMGFGRQGPVPHVEAIERFKRAYDTATQA